MKSGLSMENGTSHKCRPNPFLVSERERVKSAHDLSHPLSDEQLTQAVEYGEEKSEKLKRRYLISQSGRFVLLSKAPKRIKGHRTQAPINMSKKPNISKRRISSFSHSIGAVNAQSSSSDAA